MKNTILLIDDHKNWYDTIDFILKDEGYKVLWAQTRSDAVDCLDSSTYKIDAVIINLNLGPDSSILDGAGYLLLDYIKHKYPQLPRMAISSFLYKADKTIELYERYKVNHVVLKDNFSAPVFLNSLKTALAKTTTLKESHQEKIRSDKCIDFDVFLAHNHNDKHQIETIAIKLRQHELNPWFDKEQIPPGRWFQDIIQQAISEVKSAAIFIGTNGLGKWQIAELRLFINKCLDNGLPVIPVLLPGVNEIPEDLLFLKELKLVEFKKIDDTEALENLIWGITGKRSNKN